MPSWNANILSGRIATQHGEVLDQSVDPVICPNPFLPAKCLNVLATVSPVYDGSGKLIGADLTFNQPFDNPEEIIQVTLLRSPNNNTWTDITATARTLSVGGINQCAPDPTGCLGVWQFGGLDQGPVIVRDLTVPSPINYYLLTLTNVANDFVNYNVVSITKAYGLIVHPTGSGDPSQPRITWQTPTLP